MAILLELRSILIPTCISIVFKPHTHARTHTRTHTRTDVHLGDSPGSPPAHRKSAQIQNLETLEKQLAIEQRVKAGAETMIKVYSRAKSRSDRKMLDDAQQMLNDSRTKVEVLRMSIMKMKAVMNAADAEGQNQKSGVKGAMSQTPETRLSLLRYRVDVESRLMQGAKSIMKANPNDRKSWQSVSVLVLFCYRMYLYYVHVD